jgi:hypothetical protein
MSPRPSCASGLFVVLATAGVLLSGCSASGPHDMNKGTDVAVGFEPPEGGIVSIADAAPDGASAVEVGATDGGGAVDASTGEGE